MLFIIGFRQRGLNGKAQAVDGTKKIKNRDRVSRAMPAPEANAELQTNLDVSGTCCTFFFIIPTHLVAESHVSYFKPLVI